ncbi:MAG: hypothetical protein A3I44_05665 [Candidatus Sungbacteria bacterium RIFCSPLOWO2_02_FULL_51_17]|uniref:Uncharacterized protein n=1 Tax=Candidatus Sungbacteria bacterium RIFCSPHIGHO2_02_FULL_51_29 TaxID=1802273 RepID=A0A1G2KU38_9BACT|nr:MAG: hypothetical protein A3C16_02965 [Candidatus Sungbacteria bacterium RIFCSPHIGHO2_02_FULL_51_29]OHA11737.1 MAG: hypothetical protein A3I44_05665 [Candidatus Sungbacteria bacterium RIFCSPLOWO2_02_FULL_51_17]
MTHESIGKTATLPEQIADMILSGSKADSLIILRTLYCDLTGEKDVPQEVECVFEGLPDFLDDQNKTSFMIPLEPGGMSHVTLYREDGKISFILSAGVHADVRKRYTQLGF